MWAAFGYYSALVEEDQAVLGDAVGGGPEPAATPAQRQAAVRRIEATTLSLHLHAEPTLVRRDRFTKYVLTWDSRGVPNGSYALTATARDGAGNSATAAGSVVTIRN